MSLKEKVSNKMLEEMNEEHTSTEDKIHVWLGQQDDEKLLKGILETGKSIKGSVRYAMKKAKKCQENGVAMIGSETVFEWVEEYFIKPLAKEVKKEKTAPVEVKKKAEEPIKPKVQKKVKAEERQLNLFEL